MNDNPNPYQPVRSAPTGNIPPSNPYGAPVSNPVSRQNQLRAAPLTWGQILFSFKGRIPRRTYWGTFLITIVVSWVIFGGYIAVMGMPVTGMPLNASGMPQMTPEMVTAGVTPQVNLAVLIPLLLLDIPFIWSGLAVTIKRLHDRDRSGWFIFINLIPLIGVIWFIIEVWFRRGTVGDNRFGQDPT